MLAAEPINAMLIGRDIQLSDWTAWLANLLFGNRQANQADRGTL